MPNPHYCCTTPGAICFWFAALAIFYGVGLLLGVIWPALDGYESSILFGAIALACFANFAKNRTVHCAVTGPIFLAAAVAAALRSAGVWSMPEGVLWPLVLIGVGIAFVIEWRVTRQAG
ncbi:MAG TPA: hypothetical protein VLE48_13775 [Terriglobales bacterium]|nr:hypothetical protein [Terriglobales bacterium]